jgi:hypothetical protein
MTRYAVLHTFLSFGCLHTVTVRTFPTKAAADTEVAELTANYQRWRTRNPDQASPCPSTFATCAVEGES